MANPLCLCKAPTFSVSPDFELVRKAIDTVLNQQPGMWKTRLGFPESVELEAENMITDAVHQALRASFSSALLVRRVDRQVYDDLDQLLIYGLAMAETRPKIAPPSYLRQLAYETRGTDSHVSRLAYRHNRTKALAPVLMVTVNESRRSRT